MISDIGEGQSSAWGAFGAIPEESGRLRAGTDLMYTPPYQASSSLATHREASLSRWAKPIEKDTSE